jgi:RES domain-containing protein
MRLSSCSKLALRSINATWYRAIATKYWKTALQTSHTAQVTTRFNPGVAAKTPFEILYLGENQLVALYEVGAIFGPAAQPVPNPHQSKMVPIDVQVTLQSVADLTDLTQQKLLDTSVQELTGNWDTYLPGDAPTQQLGAALFATTNIEGFLAISAKMPRCKALIVFPQKLIKRSALVFTDTISSKSKTHRIAP